MTSMRYACSLDSLQVGRVYRLIRDGGRYEIPTIFGGYDVLVGHGSGYVRRSMRSSTIWWPGKSFTYNSYGYSPDARRPHHVVNYWNNGEWSGWDHADRWFSPCRPRSWIAWIELVESTETPVADVDPLAVADRRRDDLLRKMFS